MRAPFTTNNDAQAFALYMAGAQMVPPYVKNEYTPDMLRGMGLQGVKPLDAIKLAQARDKRGAVTYFFNPEQELRNLSDAYDDQIKRLDADDAGTVQEEIVKVEARFLDGQITRQEKDVRVACCFMRGRKLILNFWKQCQPTLLITKGGSRSDVVDKDTGGRTVTHPGFIVVSANASEETKERLGL